MGARVDRADARIYFLPFILGSGKQARRLSSRLFSRFRIVSFVCNPKKSLWDSFDISCRHMSLCESRDVRLIAEQLLWAAERYSGYLPILIPVSDEYSGVIDEQRELLESRFIIREADEIFLSSPLCDIE